MGTLSRAAPAPRFATRLHPGCSRRIRLGYFRTWSGRVALLLLPGCHQVLDLLAPVALHSLPQWMHSQPQHPHFHDLPSCYPRSQARLVTWRGKEVGPLVWSPIGVVAWIRSPLCRVGAYPRGSAALYTRRWAVLRPRAPPPGWCLHARYAPTLQLYASARRATRRLYAIAYYIYSRILYIILVDLDI